MYAGVRYGPEAWVRYSPPVFGVLLGALLPAQREGVATTLTKLNGPAPAWRRSLDIARVFANYGSCMTDAMLVAADRGYKAQVRASNGGRDFKASAAMERGVILATAHTAGWDLAGPMLKIRRDSEVLVVMERERDSGARSLHDRLRQRAGVRIVHAGDDPLSALPLLRHLRQRKGAVAMKFDRTAPGMRARSVRFLGEPWQIPQGIFTLAAVSGAPILPVFTRRLGFMQYEYVTSPPISVSRRADDAELDATAQQLTSLLEDFVRANPGQWFRFSEP